MDNLNQEVINIIADCIEIKSEEILNGSLLSDLPEWSSIMFVMVVAKLEERFKIILEPDALFDVESVEDLVDAVRKNILE